MAKLLYPPHIEIESNMVQSLRWPREQFDWVKALMRESSARASESLEILQYYSFVLKGNESYRHFTRNTSQIETILAFLADQVGLSLRGNKWALDLCAGIGAITTPLARYFKVLAVELKQEYIDLFQAYLDDTKVNATHEICRRIRLLHGDIRKPKTVESKIRDIQPHFEAVVTNPHFDFIPQALDISEKVATRAIVAVMPLDVLEETAGVYTYRSEGHEETVEKDRAYLLAFRQRWDLIALHPFLRHDGTAQTGAFLFTPKT